MGRPPHSQLHMVQPDPLDSKSKPQPVRLALYRNVANVEQLLEALHKQEIDAAIVNAELIFQVFQVLAACQRACMCFAHDKMITKGIHSEIVYSLSPSRNISDSLKRFGISPTCTSLLVITHGDKSGSKLNAVHKRIKGDNVELTELGDVRDIDKIKHAYHIHSPELMKTSLEDAIVTRIAAKDYSA